MDKKDAIIGGIITAVLFYIEYNLFRWLIEVFGTKIAQLSLGSIFAGATGVCIFIILAILAMITFFITVASVFE